MTDTWINLTNGPPNVADFLSTGGLGPAAVIDKSAATLYFLGDGNVVTSLGASNTATVDLFANIATTAISTAAKILFVARRTAAGAYPMIMKPDPDQTLYTATGDALIAGVTAEGAPQIALAQAAILGILNRIRAKDASNRYWVIDDDAQEVHAGHFGAVADASYTEGTGVTTGTDSQPAIQALIDWRVYLKSGTASANRDCIIPAGGFRSNNQVQLSYGDTFRRVVLRGAGNSFPIGLGGTTVAFTDPAQPGVVNQGGRYSYVRDMALLSGGRAWILNNNIGSAPDAGAKAAGYDDRHMSAYFDPAQPLRSPRRRYAPHAAIAVDPYAGAAPAPTINAWAASTAYVFGQQITLASKLYICCHPGTSAASGGPSTTADWIKDGAIGLAAWWHYIGPSSLAQAYPTPAVAAFLPVATRIGYGKTFFSSDMPNRDVTVIGFAVGLVTQPSGADGNGDFVGLQNFSTSFTPVSMSISQTQARSNSLNRVGAVQGHTFMTGLMHGKQNGRIAGVWTDCNMGAMQQIFECSTTGSSGGLTVNNIYVEGIQRIGTFYGNTAQSDAFVFVGGQIGFTHEDTNGKRGVPLTIVGSPAYAAQGSGYNAPVIFQGVLINNYKGALTLDCNFEMRNAQLTSYEATQTIANQAQARYLNTTASGLVPMRLAFKADQLIRYYAANETTLGATGGVTNPRNTATSRDNPASMFTPSLSPTNGGIETITNIQVPTAFGMGATQFFTTVSLSGRTLTFTSAQSAANLVLFQVVPGAVMSLTNGQRYYVTGRTGAGPYTFTATLLNGYAYDNGGVISYEGGTPDFTVASTITGYFQAGGVFTPSYPLFANFAAAAANLTSLDRGDGYSGHITTTSPVAAGDSLCVDQYVDSPLTADKLVSSVTAGVYPNAIITLNFPAGLTATKRRIPLWVRGS